MDDPNNNTSKPLRPMRFGIIAEGCVPSGMTHHRRYKQMIAEAAFAEELGFDIWGCSEQHFHGGFGISSTEVLYGAVAQHTSKIRLRHMIRLGLEFNHPIRTAEQAATVDLVSDGRLELGLGRSNTPAQLDAFGVEAADTKAQMWESMDIIVKAFSQETVSHEGRFWNIPEPVPLTPKPLQYPHPPLSIAATSVESITQAANKGLGVMAMDHYTGWDTVKAHADAYHQHIQSPTDPVTSVVNNSLGFLCLPAYCDETDERAHAVGGPGALEFAQALQFLYAPMAKKSADYAYFNDVTQFADKVNDLEYFLETTPSMMVGSPEFFIKQIRRLQDLGYDEVILRVDGFMSHEKIMNSLRLIGDYVIPEFRHPHNIVRHAFSGGAP
ncbi:MAG: LLM class flavin-dependent oxidoreductase [Immundisolibacteraceae bacterium]|nr:LLM class flavin-dependent oxidoreductase [Immundisolibacteraceae bacterium]